MPMLSFDMALVRMAIVPILVIAFRIRMSVK
jgi:hypothetical protein